MFNVAKIFLLSLVLSLASTQIHAKEDKDSIDYKFVIETLEKDIQKLTKEMIRLERGIVDSKDEGILFKVPLIKEFMAYNGRGLSKRLSKIRSDRVKLMKEVKNLKRKSAQQAR